MKTITKFYNKFCSAKYQPINFVRYKSLFIRLNGEILQVFNLKQSRNASACNVEFGIFPLCLPQPIFLDAGRYELDAFLTELRSGWSFDSNSEESMMDCVKSISKAIDMYLLPFFEKCYDCESALSELIKLEELFDCNRQKRLHLMGEYDSAAPWQERSLFDYRKYYMALKSRNLSYAEQYLNYQVNFHKNELKYFNNPNSPNQPETVIRRFEAKLSLVSEQLERLLSGDFGYFDDLIKSNESEMLLYLADKYPKVCPTDSFKK